MELLSQLKETGWPPPVRSSWLLKAASRGRRVAVSRQPLPPGTNWLPNCCLCRLEAGHNIMYGAACMKL